MITQVGVGVVAYCGAGASKPLSSGYAITHVGADALGSLPPRRDWQTQLKEHDYAHACRTMPHCGTRTSNVPQLGGSMHMNYEPFGGRMLWHMKHPNPLKTMEQGLRHMCMQGPCNTAGHKSAVP